MIDSVTRKPAVGSLFPRSLGGRKARRTPQYLCYRRRFGEYLNGLDWQNREAEGYSPGTGAAALYHADFGIGSLGQNMWAL